MENDDTLWPPLTKGKGRKEKKKKIIKGPKLSLFKNLVSMKATPCTKSIKGHNKVH